MSYDRLGKREVHHHLTGGAGALHEWIKAHRVEPEPRLAAAQTHALTKLSEQTGHEVDELLREAVNLLLDKRRAGSAPKR